MESSAPLELAKHALLMFGIAGYPKHAPLPAPQERHDCIPSLEHGNNGMQIRCGQISRKTPPAGICVRHDWHAARQGAPASGRFRVETLK
ncbi:MAG: hypothetical protein PHD65_00950 [Gallionella sp.]|nr:hypothetical protein [Gallionella sp.]